MPAYNRARKAQEFAMSVMLNHIMFAGNITRDPQVKFFANERAVCNFTIAHNESYTKKETGEKVESVAFVDCEAWGRAAELIGQYCQKGSNLLVIGKLGQDNWEDKKDGSKRSKIKIVVSEFKFLDKAPGKDGAAPAGDTGGGEPAGDEPAPAPAARAGRATSRAGAGGRPAPAPAAADDEPPF